MITFVNHWRFLSLEDLDQMPLTELQLPVRVFKRLDYEGIKSIGALVRKSGEDLLAMYGFGKTGLRHVRIALAERGICLRKDEPQ